MLTEPDSFFAYISNSATIGHCNNFMIEKLNQFQPKSKLNEKFLYIYYGAKDPVNQIADYLPKFNKLLISYLKENLTIEIKALKDGGHVPEGSIREGLNFIYKNN